MSEPNAARPVPGPVRPPAAAPDREDTDRPDRFADLDDRPVGEHVEVFEAEHDRLQTELGTIDRV